VAECFGHAAVHLSGTVRFIMETARLKNELH
jgi:hypothetical protein